MDIFVARQPILDRHCEIHAYELLYRDGLINACNAVSLDIASSTVIGNSFLVMGFDSLTRGRGVFLNVTEQVVTASYLSLLPKNAVIELLETVRPTPEVLESCRLLKAEGFRLALDDFVYEPDMDPLLEIADVVKLDWRQQDRRTRARMVPWLREQGIRVLAEKVETWEEYDEAARLGCSYFQGYFFSKPEVMKGRELATLELVNLELMRELNRPNLDYDAVEALVKREVSLAYKLLRYINSCAIGLRNEIRSIRHAIVLLGPVEFSRWATLATIASLAPNKPRELLVQASTRGRLAELLAPDVGMPARDQELFLLGMFSLLDAILDRPLDLLLGELGVSRDVESALLRQEPPLSHVLDCIVAIEHGDWKRVAAHSSALGVSQDVLARKYRDAVTWADRSGHATPERGAA